MMHLPRRLLLLVPQPSQMFAYITKKGNTVSIQHAGQTVLAPVSLSSLWEELMLRHRGKHLSDMCKTSDLRQHGGRSQPETEETESLG